MTILDDIFTAGGGGYACDFRNTSDVYQDSAKTTPWASSGDPVGAILARGGSSVTEILQSTSGLRPPLQVNSGEYELSFDGTDYFSNITFSLPSPVANYELTYFAYMNYNTGGYHNIYESTATTRANCWIDPANKIEVNGTEGKGPTSAVSYAGSWKFIVIQDRITDRNILINDVVTDTSTTDLSILMPTGSTTFSLFNRNGGTAPFKGKIRNGFGIIGRRLTTAEMTSLYSYYTTAAAGAGSSKLTSPKTHSKKLSRKVS